MRHSVLVPFRTIALLLLAACALTAGGCGNTEELLAMGRALEHSVRPLSQPLAHQGLDVAAAKMAETGNWQEVREGLYELYFSSDAYEKAIASAVCGGMAQVGSSQNDPSATASSDSWKSFLENYVKDAVSRATGTYLIDTVNAKVNGLMTAWNISQVSSSTAAAYWRLCQGRSP